ncbi:hypothetical protein G9A89_006931 [Geosiphon pyriformis]|nr:hypothetical protein G9A89_006931 [Geosiphon pyriformis]
MVDIEINLDKTETIVIKPSKKKSVLVEPLKFGPNKQILRLLDLSTCIQYLGVWIQADRKNETVLKMIRSDIEAVLATTSDITTLEYYQSIYTHCKQQFEIHDGIIAFKKTLYQYIENRINDYLFGNYNITTVKRDLLENILHYSNTESENISAEACTTYFEELDYNIIRFCEEKYPANAQFAFELKSEPETTENQSEHSETAANEENNSEITEEELIDSENKEDKMTTYIAKIPDFNGKDIETSPQEWLDQVTKAGDANG